MVRPQAPRLPSRCYCATHLLEDGFRRGRIQTEIRPFEPDESGKRGSETAAAFHPTTGELVTGATDGKVRFWNIHTVLQEPFLDKVARWNAGGTDRTTKIIAGHTSPVRALAFTSNGLTLVSAADDKKVLVWVPKP